MLYIFDMGGVVTTTANVFGECARRIGITEEDFISYARGTKGKGDSYGDMIKGASDGDFSTKELWKIFEERSGIRVKTDWLHYLFHPEYIKGTRRLVALLKSQGNRVVCGTNTIDSHYHNHLERGDYTVFDQTYASCFMGVSKPDVEFWKIILSAENAKPEDTVFIDDREENVNAARSLGIKSYLFTDAFTLAKELDIKL